MTDPDMPNSKDASADRESDLQTELALVEMRLASMLTPIAPGAGLLKRLLQSVEHPPMRFAPFFSRTAKLFDLSEAEIETQFSKLTDEANFEESGAPGVKQLHITPGPALKDAQCGLLRCAPNAVIPWHRHIGAETVLVLEGGYVDDHGTEYLAGQWHHMPAGSEHQLRALPDEGCLIACAVGAYKFLSEKRR